MGNILSCIAEMILGILLLMNPAGFTFGVMIALGIVLAIMGVSCIGDTSGASTNVLWMFIAVSLIVEAIMDILTFIFGRK